MRSRCDLPDVTHPLPASPVSRDLLSKKLDVDATLEFNLSASLLVMHDTGGKRQGQRSWEEDGSHRKVQQQETLQCATHSN